MGSRDFARPFSDVVYLSSQTPRTSNNVCVNDNRCLSRNPVVSIYYTWDARYAVCRLCVCAFCAFCASTQKCKSMFVDNTNGHKQRARAPFNASHQTIIITAVTVNETRNKWKRKKNTNNSYNMHSSHADAADMPRSTACNPRKINQNDKMAKKEREREQAESENRCLTIFEHSLCYEVRTADCPKMHNQRCFH